MARFSITLTDGTLFETDGGINLDANGWLVFEEDGTIVGIPGSNIKFVRDTAPQGAGPLPEEVPV